MPQPHTDSCGYNSDNSDNMPDVNLFTEHERTSFFERINAVLDKTIRNPQAHVRFKKTVRIKDILKFVY